MLRCLALVGPALRRFASGVDANENVSAIQYAVELQPSRAVILCFVVFSNNFCTRFDRLQCFIVRWNEEQQQNIGDKLISANVFVDGRIHWKRVEVEAFSVQ